MESYEFKITYTRELSLEEFFHFSQECSAPDNWASREHPEYLDRGNYRYKGKIYTSTIYYTQDGNLVSTFLTLKPQAL